MAPLQPQLVLPMPAPPERATTWIWAVAAPRADRRPTSSSPNRTKTGGLAASVLVTGCPALVACCATGRGFPIPGNERKKLGREKPGTGKNRGRKTGDRRDVHQFA